MTRALTAKHLHHRISTLQHQDLALTEPTQKHKFKDMTMHGAVPPGSSPPTVPAKSPHLSVTYSRAGSERFVSSSSSDVKDATFGSSSGVIARGAHAESPPPRRPHSRRGSQHQIQVSADTSQIQLIVMDLDGVLVDSREMHYLALNRALESIDPKVRG